MMNSGIHVAGYDVSRKKWSPYSTDLSICYPTFRIKSNVAFGLFVILGLTVAIGAAAGPYFYFKAQDAKQQTVISNEDSTITETITVRSGLTEEDRQKATEDNLLRQRTLSR